MRTKPLSNGLYKTPIPKSGLSHGSPPGGFNDSDWYLGIDVVTNKALFPELLDGDGKVQVLGVFKI